MIKDNTPDEKTLKEAIETSVPYPKSAQKTNMSRQEKIDYIAARFKEIMVALDLDVEDESLGRTPYRIAKMYVDEIFSGLDETTFPEIRFVTDHYSSNKKSSSIFLKVNFNSFCEHHFVPMSGVVYVAYVPNKKLIGLSKIPRIVRFFSSRPQLQERLTAQIADSLQTLLVSPHIAVCIVAKHHCMIARGIEDSASHTVTQSLRGDFEKDPQLRQEFFNAMKRESI